MEEKTIRAIRPVSLGLMVGAVSAVMAFLGAILLVLFMLPSFRYAQGFEWVSILGGLWVLVIPMVMFIVGFVEGFFVAVIHNFLEPRIGGIKLRLD